ncbi:hypothetical protein KCU65_g6997, partial [Aureobasidium melanogenum]
MSQQNNQSNKDVNESAGASHDTTTAPPPPPPPPAAAPVVAASGRTCTTRADPSDRFDARGRAWCEYHGRFTPSHSTRYCSAHQAHERRDRVSQQARERSRVAALQILVDIASGRSSSSGGIQKPRAQGKGKGKNKIRRLAAAALDRITKLEAEKGSSKNLPARGPLKKDPNNDEDGPGGPGSSQQITV